MLIYDNFVQEGLQCFRAYCKGCLSGHIKYIYYLESALAFYPYSSILYCYLNYYVICFIWKLTCIITMIKIRVNNSLTNLATPGIAYLLQDIYLYLGGISVLFNVPNHLNRNLLSWNKGVIPYMEWLGFKRQGFYICRLSWTRTNIIIITMILQLNS